MKKFTAIMFCLLLAAGTQAQAWFQRTNIGAPGRHRASGFAIGNHGYIGIGHVNGNNASINYKDWWEYDPASDSWSQKADFPVANYGAVSFATSTRGYVGGGAALAGEFYEFNPLTNTWTAIPNCPVSPGDQSAFCVNNKGYVYFGTNFYEYDPASSAWTQKQSPPVTFSNWCVSFTLGSSGFVKSGSMLYEYKPLANQWLLKASFPGQATNGCGAFVRDGKAVIVSGYVGSLTNVTSEVWEYNPASNSWARLNDFPGSARRFTVGFTINNRGYFGTGTNGINFNDFWEMDDAVGIAENQAASISVYPNPVTEYFRITADETSNTSLQMKLFNSEGQLIDERTISSSTDIQRNGLPSGMYICQLLKEDQIIHTEKLIFR